MVRAFSLLAAAVPLVGAVILWRLARSRGKSSRTPSNKRTPKRLILVRHGESQGNIDHTIYEHTPDNALHLTERGWEQALSAGNALRKIISDETVCFFVSPYVRTRETLHAIARAFGGLSRLRWIEDPRIREQDFGNFQDPERTIKFKEERKRFGSFFYRFPDGGESAADVFDRVSSFMESMVRHWENHTDVENYVLVIHGVTVRKTELSVVRIPVRSHPIPVIPSHLPPHSIPSHPADLGLPDAVLQVLGDDKCGC